MMPGTGLARRGVDGDADKKLPKGLVGRVWRDVARPYRAKASARSCAAERCAGVGVGTRGSHGPVHGPDAR